MRYFICELYYVFFAEAETNRNVSLKISYVSIIFYPKQYLCALTHHLKSSSKIGVIWFLLTKDAALFN